MIKTVLLAEDSQATLDMYLRILQGVPGLRVLAASQGDKALDIFCNNPEIDLVISDNQMPGLNGVELAYRIATLKPGTPFVLVTGDDRIKAKANGNIARVLYKPITSEALLGVVREYIA